MPDERSPLSFLRRTLLTTANVTYDLLAAVMPLSKRSGATTRSDGRSSTGRSAEQRGLTRLGAGAGARKGGNISRRRRDGPAFTVPAAIVARARRLSAVLFGNYCLWRGYDSASTPGKRKTLVLDLDETLIHSTSRGSRNHDHVIEVLVDKHVCLYYIYKRPFVDFFLRKVSEWYDVVIFTASMPEYADPVIDYLDVSRTLISRRYFRQSCTQHNGTYIKDLAIIEPDLSRVFLIDNSPISYAINQDNGIPIDGWISDPLDESLLDLLPFLDSLRYVDDVRSVLSLRI